MPGSTRTARILRELTHPLQKMHDTKVIKVNMWLVVEEVRANQSVMAWGMVFGVLVLEVRGG